MDNSQLFSSFMMLTEHLYDKFVEYILNERCRAPPESELIEMLPTFQLGAKTDRRAVQSKFKSWAKRMRFVNNALVLASTGKIIVPKEMCENLIMHMHSEEHVDIEIIIDQIRRTYTWTRKNFGMDKDIVVGSIMGNCKKEECIKKMRLEIAKLGNSFCVSNVPVPGKIQQMPFGMPAHMAYFPPYYPVPVPIAPFFDSSRFPFHIPFLKDEHSSNFLKATTNEAKGTSTNTKENVNPKTYSKIKGKFSSAVHKLSNEANSDEKVISAKFKRPTNANEYKMLMEAVKKSCGAFPKILAGKKNQFLSCLGIAPKIICSTRTLKRFRKELRHKQLMTRNCMIYRDRKILRDRNKLKKSSVQKKQKQHNYLGLPLLRKEEQREVEDFMYKHFQSFKTVKKQDSESKSSRSQAKRIKACDGKKYKSIEVITIDCSDEETASKNAFLFKEKETKEVNLKQDEETNSTQAETNDQPLEETTEQSCSNNIEKLEKCDKQKAIQMNTSDNLYNTEDSSKNSVSETSQTSSSEEFQHAILNEQIILLQMQNNNFTGIPKEKYFPVSSQFAVLQPTKETTVMATNASSYSAAPLNPTSADLRKTSSVFSIPLISEQNKTERIVYPVKLTKAASSKIVLVDKRQQEDGTYVVAPSQNKLALPQKDTRIQPQRVFLTGIPSSMIPAHLRQLRPKPPENETTGNYRKLFANSERSKIDINDEMVRIAAWIYRMKSILNPCLMNNGEEKSVQKLLSHLDFGIHLVREAKKSLDEIAHVMDASEPTMKPAE